MHLPFCFFILTNLHNFYGITFQFESMFEELSTSLEKILLESRTGVILQLCEGCLRHKTKQSVFIQVSLNTKFKILYLYLLTYSIYKV